MKILSLIGILLLPLMGFADVPSSIETQIGINTLRFTNRAQCAVDSVSPTKSAFVLIDSFNAGKMGHSLAQMTGADPAVISSETMLEFRLATYKILSSIIEKIRSRQLPLLPVNVDTTQNKLRYSRLVENCKDKVYCDTTEKYLLSLWNLSSGKPTLKQMSKIDSFTEGNLLSPGLIQKSTCYYVKRFSALQGHLHSTEVNAAVLTDIGQAVLHNDQLLTACDNSDSTLDSRNAALQFDLSVGNAKAWALQGFEFWNSVRVYLSWAWRNAPEMAVFSAKYGPMFRSLAFEESIMMIPNGCASLSPPSCDSEYLSINSLRELAKINPTPEHSDLVPDGADKELLEKGARAVNDDFLGTRSYDKASEWVANFRKNYVQSRGSMKSKLLASIQNLNMIEDSLPTEELNALLLPLTKQPGASANLKDELYYLCTEARLAGDVRLDFLKSDIDRISQLESMAKANTGFSRPMTAHIDYFNALSAELINLCDRLEAEKYWEGPSYVVDKSGFEPWAKELLSIPARGANEPIRPPLVFNQSPLLVWNKSLGDVEGNMICASAIDCSRKVFKSLVDLYAVSTYADAFLPVSATAASPSVFNPYAELAACKMYDPWFQQNRVRKRFMWDLGNTALFGWNAIPFYMDVDYSAPRVTSFNQLLKDGVIKFNPNIEESKMMYSLIADFGPFVGAPCAISISPNSGGAFNFYAFKGISVNYCAASDKKNGNVEKPNDIKATPAETKSYCGGCSLNFVSVASATSSIATTAFPGINPFKLGIYLFRAIYRYSKGMNDKVNIPRTQLVNPRYVAEALKKNGKIPEDCVPALSQGLKCNSNLCLARVQEHFESTYGAEAKKVVVGFDRDAGGSDVAWVETPLCKGSIAFRYDCDPKAALDESRSFSIQGKPWATTASCKDLIK